MIKLDEDTTDADDLIDEKPCWARPISTRR